MVFVRVVRVWVVRVVIVRGMRVVFVGVVRVWVVRMVFVRVVRVRRVLVSKDVCWRMQVLSRDTLARRERLLVPAYATASAVAVFAFRDSLWPTVKQSALAGRLENLNDAKHASVRRR